MEAFNLVVHNNYFDYCVRLQRLIGLKKTLDFSYWFCNRILNDTNMLFTAI